MEYNFVILVKDDGLDYSTLWKSASTDEDVVLQEVINSYSKADLKKVEYIKVFRIEKEPVSSFVRSLVTKEF